MKSAYVDENGQTKPHYDGLYSIAGYINRSYFCDRCCYGKECFEDNLKKKPQKESPMIKQARELLQERIDQDIQPKVIEKSVCESRRKCKSCQGTYTVNPKFPHKCLRMECKNCLKSVNISEHQCYIISDDERKLLLKERNAKNFGKCLREVNKMETENGELV